MGTLYNIYRIDLTLLDGFNERLSKTDLVKQESIESVGFTSTFFYSENTKGTAVWWWSAYKDYITNKDKEPKNIFHYGLLISIPKTESAKFAYVVSLGKSHFYLSDFIERDFGINIALRIADKKTVLLKKSTYFSNVKKADISSYERFIPDNFEPGESVDHLKLKAEKQDIWGERNIIFSDSIQLNDECKPAKIESLLNKIEETLNDDEAIHLPKLEMIKGIHNIDYLDSVFLSKLKANEVSFSISDFEILGSSIYVLPDNHEYIIYVRNKNGSHEFKKKLGTTIEFLMVIDYIKELPDEIKLNQIKVKVKSEASGVRTRTLKETIDFSFTHENDDLFIKNGIWHKFNDTFITYLNRALETIEIFPSVDLIEKDYEEWKVEKKKLIAKSEETNNDSLIDNKLTYREYYFNKMLSEKLGYALWDRDNKPVKSLKDGEANYKVEVADLYKDSEVISLKISSDPIALIYNITQSLTSLELYKQQALSISEELKTVSLWFVFDKKIEKITDFNSIQFLLAVEKWRKTVLHYGLTPKIYISKHVKEDDKTVI